MLSMNIKLPLQYFICWITQSKVLHEWMEARVFLIIYDFLLELDDVGLYDEFGLNSITRHYLRQKFIPDKILKENR